MTAAEESCGRAAAGVVDFGEDGELAMGPVNL